jgi:hypothetical protein
VGENPASNKVVPSCSLWKPNAICVVKVIIRESILYTYFKVVKVIIRESILYMYFKVMQRE